MARGTTLQELLKKLRHETGRSGHDAFGQNERETLVTRLNNTQEWLYDNWNWPFLFARRDKNIQAGLRYYDVPNDLVLESVSNIRLKHGGQWYDLWHGITEHHYNTVDSDNNERRDPVERWDIVNTGSGEQIELWPVPDNNDDTLRFSGMLALPEMISDNDKALLDDWLIVYFTAAELMVSVSTREAQQKLNAANSRLKRIRANLDHSEQGGIRMSGRSVRGSDDFVPLSKRIGPIRS